MRYNSTQRFTVALATGILALPIAATVHAQAAFDTVAMRRTVDSMRTAMNIPGATVAIVTNDGRTWTTASGVANGAGAAMSSAMLLEIGSITKTYVAALVLDRVGAGALSLDDTLGKWIRVLPHGGGATIRQLLQHTSGLHNYSENPAYVPALRADFTRVWEPQDSYKFMLAPYFAPGKGWKYSSANYLVLGQIVENVEKQPIAATLRARVLSPRRLARTFFAPGEEPENQRAHAFLDVTGDGKPEDFTSMVPNTSFITAAGAAGALVATAEDVARFANDLFNQRIVRGSLFGEMTRWVDRGDGMQHGLGVIRYVADGKELLGHKGNTVGYSAGVWHATERGMTVAVLTNANAVDVTPIVRALLR